MVKSACPGCVVTPQLEELGAPCSSLMYKRNAVYKHAQPPKPVCLFLACDAQLKATIEETCYREISHGVPMQDTKSLPEVVRACATTPRSKACNRVHLGFLGVRLHDGKPVAAPEAFPITLLGTRQIFMSKHCIEL
eukprot:4679979-Amphidinium_carterae.1